MTDFNLTRVDRLRYRPTKVAEQFLDQLRTTLIPGDKATVARLAIGRSLSESFDVLDFRLPETEQMGNAIEGTHLFGDDGDVWACLLASSFDTPLHEASAFRKVVEAHWHRGANLLKADYQDAGQSDVDFVVQLAGMVPKSPPGRFIPHIGPEYGGETRLTFGTVSHDPSTGEPVSFVINSPGTSPHIALLGKTRSGKSRTGLDIGRQIAGTNELPVIIIDPKSEFVKDGRLLHKDEWDGETLERFFPGIQPIEVPMTAIPLDFLWRPPESSSQELAQRAISFKDSFEKCIRAKGDVATDRLRRAVLDLLQKPDRVISLDDVLTAYVELTVEEGKSAGGITAKLGAIGSLGMFAPERPPADFFTKRWVISFGSATEEPKRLAIFLVLDALNGYLMSMADSTVDQDGFRSLRHLLVVDEAREILSYRHGALSSLIRKSASKGGVTMLLSQSAEDFDQEEDDFLEQMGTVGVFALSSSTVKTLSGVFGRRVRTEEFSDKSLAPGVAYVKLPGESAKKLVAWSQG